MADSAANAGLYREHQAWDGELAGPLGASECVCSGVDNVVLGVLIEISLVERRGIERVEQLLGSAQPDFDAGGLLGRPVVAAVATAATGVALTDSKGALRIAKGPTSELSLYQKGELPYGSLHGRAQLEGHHDGSARGGTEERYRNREENDGQRQEGPLYPKHVRAGRGALHVSV